MEYYANYDRIKMGDNQVSYYIQKIIIQINRAVFWIYTCNFQ